MNPPRREDPEEPRTLGDLFEIAWRKYADDRLSASIADADTRSQNGSAPDDTFEGSDYEPTFKEPPWGVHLVLALSLIVVLSTLTLTVLVGLGLLLARGNISADEAITGTGLIVIPLLALLRLVVKYYFKNR